jgi:hypothetical protein
MTLDNKKRDRIVAGVLILLGLLIILTPWYIFPICEIAEKSGNMQMASGSGNDMNMNSSTHMTCWYTAEAETGTGALAILAGLVLLAWPNRESRRSLGIITIGLGVVTILFPTYLIGTCTSPDSACNIGTKPALIILGVLTVITGIYLVLARDKSPVASA